MSIAFVDDDVNVVVNSEKFYFIGERDFIQSLNIQLENSAKIAADSFIKSYAKAAEAIYENLS